MHNVLPCSSRWRVLFIGSAYKKQWKRPRSTKILDAVAADLFYIYELVRSCAQEIKIDGITHLSFESTDAFYCHQIFAMFKIRDNSTVLHDAHQNFTNPIIYNFKNMNIRIFTDACVKINSHCRI